MTTDPQAPQSTDETHMRAALVLARLSLPSPNPPVGAVLVDARGTVVGVGTHLRSGEPHAEAVALAEAGTKSRGGTLYVTLEPCNHLGKTPPCTDAILGAGVARVVVGVPDPNPHVEGGGIDRLRAGGAVVELGVLGAECAALVEPWSAFITTGLPHVSLKLALSLDGRIATRTGSSRWVTGPEARAKVHELRAHSDGVAVGIRTAITDDPLLTVRDPDFAQRNPARIIFDSRLRLPLASRLVQSAADHPVIVIGTLEAPEASEQALVNAGCSVLRCVATAEGRVDMESALQKLASLGIVSLLVEGGAEIAGSVLASRLVHRLHAFVAPLLLGPRGRAGAVDWAGPDTPQAAPRILEPTWELVGRDAYVSGPIVFPEPDATD